MYDGQFEQVMGESNIVCTACLFAQIFEPQVSFSTACFSQAIYKNVQALQRTRWVITMGHLMYFVKVNVVIYVLKMYIIELKLEGGFAIQYELGCISLRYMYCYQGKFMYFCMLRTLAMVLHANQIR